MNATTLDLRCRTHEVLSSLDRGETVVITFRGKPRDVIVPYRETTAAKDVPPIMDHPFIGMWAAHGNVKASMAIGNSPKRQISMLSLFPLKVA